MSLSVQAVRVANGHDEDGRLVFDKDRLVAVLVRLSNQHEVAHGEWFYEAGFGLLNGPDHPTFATLEKAGDYIAERLRQVHRREHVR